MSDDSYSTLKLLECQSIGRYVIYNPKNTAENSMKFFAYIQVFLKQFIKTICQPQPIPACLSMPKTVIA